MGTHNKAENFAVQGSPYAPTLLILKVHVQSEIKMEEINEFSN